MRDYRGSWGAFDWQVAARAGVTDAEFQSRDVFGGTSENSREFSLDLTRPLEYTGGTFRGHYGTVNTKTDSAFQIEPVSTTDVITFSYVQPILRGAWHEYATSTQKEAELNWMRQDERLRERRQLLLRDVSNAYWDLVAAEENLKVAESNVGLAVKQVDQNQRRLDAGVGTEVEVLQAQAEVARREETRLLTDVRVRQAADVLKQQLYPGRDPARWETTLKPSTPLLETVDADSAPAWELALEVAIERRSELRQSRLAIDIADVQHRRTQEERQAGLDLDLSASSQGFSGQSDEAFSTTAQYEFPTYRAALVFNYALGNTAARNADRAAWARLRQSRLEYDELESRILLEVREAVRQVRYQAEAVRAADKSLELAQRQLAAEEARYRAEQSTTFQVLEFQQDLSQAMFSSRNARSNFAKAQVALLAAQGLLGETRQP
jgi:outer membrane protein TolC